MEDLRVRGGEISSERVKGFRKALRTLHTMEGMAINIYRLQITKKPDEINRQLIVAMCNEMTHYQDFQVKLFEYGGKPSKLRWLYWIVGFVIGFSSRLLGKKAVLKADIKLEAKAVHAYDELLQTVNWDEDTRKVVEKNQSDEYGHINRWRKLLQSDAATNEA